MKSLYSRLAIAYTILFGILLLSLGVILGQSIPYFFEQGESLDSAKYILYLSIILIIAFLFATFISFRMLHVYAKPIDEVTKVAKSLADGEGIDWTLQPHLQIHNDELYAAIKDIAEDLEEITTKRGDDQDRLTTLIDSIGSGLLMFGRGGTVRLANDVFQKTFGYTENEVIGKSINSIGLPRDIEKLIEDVYMTEARIEKQIRYTGETSGYAFSVFGAPVIGNHGNWLGIVVVVHDITELIRLEEVRKDFVANVSHELRTPITSIKGFAETLLAGAMNDPNVSKNFLEIIHKESDRLHLLIDDLLILSGVERAEFSLQYTTLHLNDIVSEAMQLVSVAADEKKMTLLLEANEAYYIEGDASRLIQVIVNLLSNAIAYSHEEKNIHIRLQGQIDEVLLVIEDEGIGIDSSELPRLFERFYRVDRARSRDSGGTGLGLAIVKHLVEAHHGTVEVYSKVDVGTAFYIKLPVKQQ